MQQFSQPLFTSSQGEFAAVPVWKLFGQSLLLSLLWHNKFQNIKTYCMFIGYPRSGHSLVGSLLDAHPDAIIAHELDVLQFVAAGWPFTREQIFSLLLENSRKFSASGRKWSGYSYCVPDQWQGKFRRIEVIGDKKGGISSTRLSENLTLLTKLVTLINLPIKIIHITRNPFDNIATMAKKDHPLKIAIEQYFQRAKINQKLLKTLPTEQILTLKQEDLIINPQQQLKLLVEHLGLEYSDDYGNSCAKIIYRQPHHSRHDVDWPAEQLRQIQQQIQIYKFLRDYKFS